MADRARAISISRALRTLLDALVGLYLFLPHLLARMLPVRIVAPVMSRAYESLPLRHTITMDGPSPGNASFVVEVINQDTWYRVDTFYEKEPLTLDWVRRMPADSVLWDVGANVGLYSLYAAKCGVSVVAFEPSFANFYALNRNMFINRCDSRIKAYCLAFSDEDGFGTFNMADVAIGGAFYQYSDTDLDDFDYPGVGAANVVFRQGSLALKLDTAASVLGLGTPDYLKIDVDGVEGAIVDGGREFFADPTLKEILIEINAPDDRSRISAVLESCSFRLAGREQCDGDIYNYLYTRP